MYILCCRCVYMHRIIHLGSVVLTDEWMVHLYNTVSFSFPLSMYIYIWVCAKNPCKRKGTVWRLFVFDIYALRYCCTESKGTYTF